MSEVTQDIRLFAQEALVRRKTAEQARSRAKFRRCTQILVVLWAALLALSYFSVRKFVRILHQLPSESAAQVTPPAKTRPEKLSGEIATERGRETTGGMSARPSKD